MVTKRHYRIISHDFKLGTGTKNHHKSVYSYHFLKKAYQLCEYTLIEAPGLSIEDLARFILKMLTQLNKI